MRKAHGPSTCVRLWRGRFSRPLSQAPWQSPSIPDITGDADAAPGPHASSGEPSGAPMPVARWLWSHGGQESSLRYAGKWPRDRRWDLGNELPPLAREKHREPVPPGRRQYGAVGRLPGDRECPANWPLSTFWAEF